MTEVVIVSGVRTAIGNYGGVLQDTPVVKLGSIVIKEALKGVGLRPMRDPEVLSYGPEALKDVGLIELEKKKAVSDTTIIGMELEEDGGHDALELDVESSPVVSLPPPSDPQPRGRHSFEEEDADVLAMEALLGSNKRKKR